MNLHSSSELILSDFNFSNLPNLEVPNLDQLVELDLSFCTSLTCLPDIIGELKSLVKLDLRYCKKLASLPSSIGKLTCLVKLRLGDCCELASLPESIGELKSLVELDLHSCKKLASLPSSIGGLKSLVELTVRRCSKLASLPESIGELKCLKTLDLGYCSKLASLPNSIYGLESLKWLDVGDCGKLNGFPILNRRRSEVEEIASTTNKLGCLQYLNMIDCHVLEIPGSIGSWVSLTTLELHGNDFERIPASIKQLPVLTELDLSRCERLYHLPQLPSSLQVLDATDCISLTSVEARSEFTH
ncbi:LEUCINE RICH REPEAT CONTAINING PROTEIN [Salix viminalis]|uniref:LEUCINE RICH REPEAT CONTAINING PROTEIN n=1 Tax=Salix viminalis TaxID=40686 RepID=A0A9Q0UW93_SALVM|nr:LEUCINE RICH REPEAT CONTAINING PROTEIN [Salix viminalis]